MDDVVRIAYFDRGNEDLKYAVKTGDGWKISILVSEGATGYYPSMAILPSGQKLIAYYDKTEEAIFIIDPEERNPQFIISVKSGGENISICADPEGRLHLSFSASQNGGGLGYALYDGRFWKVQIVDSGPEAGQFNNICLLPDGRPLNINHN